MSSLRTFACYVGTFMERGPHPVRPGATRVPLCARVRTGARPRTSVALGARGHGNLRTHARATAQTRTGRQILAQRISAADAVALRPCACGPRRKRRRGQSQPRPGALGNAPKTVRQISRPRFGGNSQARWDASDATREKRRIQPRRMRKSDEGRYRPPCPSGLSSRVGT